MEEKKRRGDELNAASDKLINIYHNNINISSHKPKNKKKSTYTLLLIHIV